MADKRELTTNPDQLVTYQIKIKGHLGCQWVDWFENAVITQETCGDTLLTFVAADQAALHGMLKKVRDLGMVLLSVNRTADTDHRQEADTRS
jgi:hypothetical protein